ncbi:HET-domain-containing protein [Xylaria cf. heliscus]|nr:HET-domain-containing protein [Xylaria cf. heliscus]
MSSSYQYTPLQARDSIRVLELLPSDAQNPDVHVKIKHTNIEAARNKLVALSYTWGSSAPCRTIYNDDGNTRLEIPSNCYDAIRCIRDSFPPVTLWIDAICINQEDTMERNSQVKIMGEIYGAAVMTVVFLGDSTPGSQTLFEYLNKIDEWLVHGNNTQFYPHPTNSIINELEKLFNRAWFTRMWVIQELFRSQFVMFMCGNDATAHEALSGCLYRNEYRTRASKKYTAPMELNDHQFRDLLAEDLTPIQRLFLFAAGADSCESTDPRDRILALTPLIENRPLRLENLIDYNLSINELFYEFALLLLSEVGLALLSMIRHPHSEENSEGRLPSWVPDWTKGKGRSDRILQLPDFFKDYQCSGQYRDFHVDMANRHLVIKGVRHGYIHELGPVIRINQESYQTKSRDVRTLISEFESLIHGTNLADWPDAIKNGKFSVRNAIMFNANILALKTLTEDDIATLLSSGGPEGKIVFDDFTGEEITSNIAVRCSETRIFINSNGVLGRSPEEVQRGDLVVLVNGALAPCILREIDDNRWTIIGGESMLLDIEQDYIRRSMLLHFRDDSTEESLGWVWQYVNKESLGWVWQYVNKRFQGEEQFTIC